MWRMWDGPTKIATIIGAAGLALAIIGLLLQGRGVFQQRRRKKLRVALADQLAKAQALHREVHEGDPQRDFREVETRIAHWREETLAILTASAPEFVPVFEGSPGITQYMSQYKERDRLSNYVEARSLQLGEIISRV
jgi:hypothetical protein